MRELNKLDRFDHIDDNVDEVYSGRHRISDSRRLTRDRGEYYDDYDNEDANSKSDLLRHDEIADRLER